MNIKVKTAIVLSVVVILITSIAFRYCIPWTSDNPFNDAVFNQSTWLAAVGNRQSSNPRGPMAEDLISNHLRIGMHKKDVRQLLGRPDSVYRYERPNIDTYYIGMWSFGVDRDFIEVQYDGRNKLISVEIIHT